VVILTVVAPRSTFLDAKGLTLQTWGFPVQVRKNWEPAGGFSIPFDMMI